MALKSRRSRKKYPRVLPGWRDNFPGIEPEWVVYDSETDDMTRVHASTHREAIRKGLGMGVRPRTSMDVFPRNRDSEVEVMKPREFKEFMAKLAGD